MLNQKLNKIQEDFNKVITFSQGIPEPKTDKLFEMWKECKRDFIEVFDGKYIYEFPEKVSFELDPKEKHNRVIRFAGQVASTWGYGDLADFIEVQEEGFFNNITVSDYTAWDGKVIKKGTRLVKAFRHFVEDNRSLTDIQNEASRIIQEDKIEGTLCLSVHPLDFLSLSENTYNWRSCHSLDGEFRAGNLSYMMDKNTIICYLKGMDEAILPNFGPEVKWNSKKWRVLLYISNDWKMIFAGRQYPFDSKTGMDIVLKDLLPAARVFGRSNEYHCKLSYFSDERYTDWLDVLKPQVPISDTSVVDISYKYVPVDNKLVALEDLVLNGKGSKQFNDVLQSSCYSPIYAFSYMKSSPWNKTEDGKVIEYSLTQINRTKFNIGGYTYCLWCGEEECLTGSDSMMCENCELEHGTENNDLITTCSCCGGRMFTEDAYWVDDEEWCENCYNEYARRCECCDYVFRKEELFYDEKTQQYVCEFCLNELKLERGEE